MGAKNFIRNSNLSRSSALRIEVFTSTPAVARAMDTHPVTSFKSDQAGQGRGVARAFGAAPPLLPRGDAHDGEVSGGQPRHENFESRTKSYGAALRLAPMLFQRPGQPHLIHRELTGNCSSCPGQRGCADITERLRASDGDGDDGRRIIKPMRCQCRLEGTPASFDRQHPGTYNAMGTLLTVMTA